MRNIVIKGLLLLVFCLGLSACDNSEDHVAFEDINGAQFELSDFRGKWVLINYWASWCAPCFKEMPELNAFHASHKDHDAIVLGVNQDHVARPELQKIIKKMGVQFPTLAKDPAAQLKLASPRGVPTTLVIDPNGKVRRPLLGQQTQMTLEAAIGYS